MSPRNRQLFLIIGAVVFIVAAVVVILSGTFQQGTVDVTPTPEDVAILPTEEPPPTATEAPPPTEPPPPTATEALPPTEPPPPTATEVPPTATEMPLPTATEIPPTEPPPPTATEVPPTATESATVSQRRLLSCLPCQRRLSRRHLQRLRSCYEQRLRHPLTSRYGLTVATSPVQLQEISVVTPIRLALRHLPTCD
jgi:hypothetical protein